MVYPNYYRKFPPEIEANRGGRGSPLNRYEKVQKRFVKNSEKNDTDMNIKVG